MHKAEAAFAAFFIGVFAALGAQMAFLQIWYEAAGLTREEIGVLTALGFVARAGGSVLLPALSDRTGQPGAALGLLGLLGAAATLGHFLSPGTLLGMAPASLLLGLAFAGILPLGDAACWSSAARLGFTYRRPRAVGSFAFLSATLGLGLLATAAGVDSVLIFLAAMMMAAAIAGVWAGRFVGRRTMRRPPSLAAGLRLLARRRFALTVAAAALIQGSHSVLYVYGSIHWQTLGFSEFAIGALWSWGVLAEIGLFFLGGTLIGRLGAESCLALSGVLAATRWAAMTLDPGLAGAAALQTLHAASFALTHLAAVSMIAREAPRETAGAAQGVLAAVSGGVAMAAGARIAAWAFPQYGGGAYWIGVAFALAGVCCALILTRTPERG